MPKRRDLRLRETEPDELKDLAAIAPADIARAQDAWESLAPAEFRPLLDAVNDPIKHK